MRKFISAVMLLSGTCIGGGMLALPVASAQAGFLPALVVMAVSCCFMSLTGLMYLEASLWTRSQEVHIISMAEMYLGAMGRRFCWVVYAFISYASVVAYIAGVGQVIASWMGFESAFFPQLGCSVLLAAGLYKGLDSLGKINSWLFSSMIITFLVLMIFSLGGMDSESLVNLQRADWSHWQVVQIFPLMLAAFSFPGIVPVLYSYLNCDLKKVRWSILAGTGLTMATYGVWFFVIMGSIPYAGRLGLEVALESGLTASECLNLVTKNPWVGTLAQCFSILAISTSLIGVSLALYYFLRDGLKMQKINISSFGLVMLICVPSFFITISYEKIFTMALELTGGYGDGFVSGIIPVMIIWSGRYMKRVSDASYRILGGKPMLLTVAAFFLWVIGIESYKIFGF